eukprot:CAMPEP_0204189480 /NCGR_PEP_ID=MMETSP0361-20130328/58524_1 /ASSEMBLY_ACC=CAM_ASM_000343 /TAXON_ID=268821 /ORGANISM="Scrippsiella Hangoei, Strain SHTV-5" /LENGTH=438 /DNA_ID=CAMNT_0051150169 /DNA_START=18 /DNA_END=1335 /DNA_ORIENTATION=-
MARNRISTLASAWLLAVMLLSLTLLPQGRGADIAWPDGLHRSHPPSKTHEQEIDVEVFKEQPVGGGESVLSVSFNRSGRALWYRLAARDVFAEGVELVAFAEKGEARLDARPVSTFVSRLDHQWASAVWHDDGSLSGIFEDRGELLHLRTTMRQRPAAARASGRGVVRFVASLVGLAAGNDTTQPSDGGEVGLEASTVAGRGSVDQWWPGCYAGDDRLHVLSLGIVADIAAWDLHRDGLWSKIEAIVSQASFIYERQMNIKLEIAELIVFKTVTSEAPVFAHECSNNSASASRTFMYTKLRSLQSFPKHFRGAWHLFTGCGDGRGTVGIAAIDTMCFAPGNGGVSQLRPNSSFRPFAHELGHNLGAKHSFENGKGKTGGIMDYGTDEAIRVNGVLQFNTKFRRDELCKASKQAGAGVATNFGSAHDERPLRAEAGTPV